MRELILHIPHSSIRIPDLSGFILSNNLLVEEIDKLTDWYTDELFTSSIDIIVKAEFNRIFCDPERFSYDSQEPMAKMGMGVLYSKTDSGIHMREISCTLRDQILNKYYFPHHNLLSKAVLKQLGKYGNALIVDCHSFTDTPFIRDVDKRPNRPDINIGTDEFHTPKFILDFSITYFNSMGLTVGVNWPYSGTMVPLEYYHKRNEVNSIMIEVNRKLYLQPYSIEKNDNFGLVKEIITSYLTGLREMVS